VARQPQEASTGHRLSIAIIGLAVAARMVRHPRSYEAAIMVVIAVAAVAGLGQASQAGLWARLAAWDKRRNLATYARSGQGKRSG
jgi:hypothetical protein